MGSEAPDAEKGLAVAVSFDGFQHTHPVVGADGPLRIAQKP